MFDVSRTPQPCSPPTTASPSPPASPPRALTRSPLVGAGSHMHQALGVAWGHPISPSPQQACRNACRQTHICTNLLGLPPPSPPVRSYPPHACAAGGRKNVALTATNTKTENFAAPGIAESNSKSGSAGIAATRGEQCGDPIGGIEGLSCGPSGCSIVTIDT